MAKYFTQQLTNLSGTATKPPVAPLNGLQPMSRARVEAVIRAQDIVPTLGRGIICTWGLRGSETFFVPDTNPALVVNSHPAPTDRRLVSAGSVDLSPGSMLRAWVVAVPSGETQLPGPIAGGASGSIEIDVTWIDQDGGSETSTTAIPIPGSNRQYGAQPTNMWNELHFYDTGTFRPAGALETTERRRWCRGATVQVLVYAVGGARPVDGCVFQEPDVMALEADDDPEYWTSHLYAQPTPKSPGGPLLYPWQRFNETSPDGDRRGGTLHLMDVHHAQHKRLGPVLFSWSGASESDGSEGVQITSASLVELAGGGSTAFSLTEPGLPCGTGGHARRYSSNSPFVLRGRVAVIPVFVRIYAEVDGTGDASLRVYTREDSYIDVTVPNGAGTPAWTTEYGWLEVGINPDDTSSLRAQLFAAAPAAGLLPYIIVHGITVHYAGGYSPAA